MQLEIACTNTFYIALLASIILNLSMEIKRRAYLYDPGVALSKTTVWRHHKKFVAGAASKQGAFKKRKTYYKKPCRVQNRHCGRGRKKI